MIDTHCHLTYEPLVNDVDRVVARAVEAGVDRMITVGTSPDDAHHATKLAETYGNVFATVGVHPHYVEQWQDRGQITDSMVSLARHRKVVALGEMGLDRHYPDPPLELQKRIFQWQLEVAVEVPAPMPIIIHNREATDQCLAMIRDSGIDPARFVFHCFTGTGAELDAVLEFGAMVSFTGIVTFSNAGELADCAARVPIDRLMIETDSPFLTPAPHRKVRPNEPRFVPWVARFIAEKRGMSEEQFVRQVDANAEGFFGLV